MTDQLPEQKNGGAAAEGQPGAEPAAALPEAAAAPGDAGAQALQEDRDRFYDLLLRKTAEFDNYRRRTEKERRDLSDRIAGDVLLELLPVIDDMERALKTDAGSDSADAYRKGVELIHRQLMDLLKRRNVHPIEALGRDFDPHLHQAVTTGAPEGARDGEVIEELRRGYLIGERLLRPAMVKVARS